MTRFVIKVKNMVFGRSNLTLGRSEYLQKSLSKNMIRKIEQFRRKLQAQENMINGRKARTVSFVYASKKMGEQINIE